MAYIFYGAAYNGIDTADYEVKATITVLSQNQTTKKTQYRIVVNAKNISDSIGGSGTGNFENIVAHNGTNVKNSTGSDYVALDDINDVYNMMDYTGEITHAGDGSAVVDFYCYQAVDDIYSFGYLEIEGRWEVPSMFSNSAFTATDTMILTGTLATSYDVYTAGYTHNLLAYSPDGTLLFTRTGIGGTTAGTHAYNIIFTTAEANSIRAKMTTPTINIKLSLQTMLNGAQYGLMSSQNVLVSSPAADAPTAPTLALTEQVTALAALTNSTNFYKGLSTVKATASGSTPISGRTIARYEIVYNSTTYKATYITFTISEVKTYSVTAYAVDSIGLKSAGKTVTFTSKYYQPIKINSRTAYRADGSGNELLIGEQFRVIVDLSFGSIKNGQTEANEIKYKIESCNSSWVVQSTPRSYSVITGDIDDVIGTFSAASTYYMRITVQDKLSSAVNDFVIGPGKASLSITADAVGILKDPVSGATGLDVAGNYYLDGVKVSDDFVVATYGTNATGYRKYKSGRLVQWRTTTWSSLTVSNVLTSLDTANYVTASIGDWPMTFNTVTSPVGMMHRTSAVGAVLNFSGASAASAGNVHVTLVGRGDTGVQLTIFAYAEGTYAL